MSQQLSQPELIQGGMGVAVSSWRLARAVSAMGQLGVVSGTALDVVLARRLQLGDPGGEIRRALDAFPDQTLVSEVLRQYFVLNGKPPAEPFRSVPMFAAGASRRLQSLAVLGGFVEVFLAREGHTGKVGINFLQKVQLPTAAVLYGAMLAGVDYVLVGAGIPRDVPVLLDRLVLHEAAKVTLQVAGALPGEQFTMTFDPSELLSTAALAPMVRPRFLAIVSSATLAASLARNGSQVDGFVVENYTAGGHNAPPRGRLTLSETGEPEYGPKDTIDLERMREIGRPFWLAGGSGTSCGIEEAKRAGAEGIQVGTLFAYCDESGIDPALRAQVLAQVRARTARVVTDPLASPTGFPFKVVQVDNTLSDDSVYQARERRCDLGYLREIYRRADGTPGYRCPGEPVDDYVAKGGAVEDTRGRKCVCNGLLATVDLAQRRGSASEPAILTAGADLLLVGAVLRDRDSYSASDVVTYLTGRRVCEAASLDLGNGGGAVCASSSRALDGAAGMALLQA